MRETASPADKAPNVDDVIAVEANTLFLHLGFSPVTVAAMAPNDGKWIGALGPALTNTGAGVVSDERETTAAEEERNGDGEEDDGFGIDRHRDLSWGWNRDLRCKARASFYVTTLMLAASPPSRRGTIVVTRLGLLATALLNVATASFPPSPSGCTTPPCRQTLSATMIEPR